MILALILAPCIFPTAVDVSAVFECNGHRFYWDGASWGAAKWKPKETGMGSCAMDEHLHSKNMDTTVPDVRGAGEPIPDGLCHKDLTDLPVTPRKKLNK